MYGALSDEVDVNSGDEAFRLVCILRKVRSPLEIIFFVVGKVRAFPCPI